MGVDRLRCFFAIPLSPQSESDLAAACDGLCQALESRVNADATLRWIHPENYHLTLAFLGDIQQRDLMALHEIALQSVAGMAATSFALRQFQWFPSAVKPRLLVAEPDACDALLLLQQRLSKLLHRQGYHVEKRAFRPHITLARLKGVDQCPDLRELELDIPCELDELVLFSSVRGRDGSTYSPLLVEPIGS